MTRNSSYVAEQLVGKLMIDLLIPSTDFSIAAEGDRAREILRNHEEEITATIRAIKELTIERCAAIAGGHVVKHDDGSPVLVVKAKSVARQIKREILALKKEDTE